MSVTVTQENEIFALFRKAKAIEIAFSNDCEEYSPGNFSDSLESILVEIDSDFSKIDKPVHYAIRFYNEWRNLSPADSGYLDGFEYTSMKMCELLQTV